MFELGLTASGRQRIDKAELDGIVKHDEPATIALPSSQLIVNISMPWFWRCDSSTNLELLFLSR